MRVAFVGKGGAGKSAIAGTFARLLARRDGPVLAVDSDPMPGLAFSLGVARSDAPIPADAVRERAEGEDGPRFRLRDDLSPVEAVRRYATEAPDGVRFLQFGKLGGPAGDLVRSQSAFRQIVSGLREDEWSLVGDLPGGTRQPFFGWAGFARTIVVVAEPTAKSLLSARRLARLALAKQPPESLVAVASKVRDPSDVDLVAERSGLEVVGSVPWDEALASAERDGRAPLDAAPDSPAVRAVTSLLDRLQERQS
jgi:CO dehydrogenase maturation factor